MSELKIIPTVKRSFNLLKKDPALLALFILPAVFPIERIIANYLMLFIILATLGRSGIPSVPSLMPPIPFQVIYLIVGFLLGVWASAGAILKVTELEKGSKLGLIKALTRGLKRIPKLLVPAIAGLALYTLMISGMTIVISRYTFLRMGPLVQGASPSIPSTVALILVAVLIFIVTLYVATRLRLSAPACVLENNFGLNTSWKVIKGNWWKVFAIFLIFGAMSALISQIPIIGIYLRGVIVEPLSITAATLIYFQLQEAKPSREEGIP
ncbi:MAG: hypothetical protein HXY36_01220 [Chloroflexi bacterium]|nr:hypothetical protein [Chloroflexota bacterium]